MKLDARQFFAVINELKREIPLAMSEIMAWAMAGLCKRLVTKTGGDPNVSMGQQKLKGERAVVGDVNRLFQPLEEYAWWNTKNGKVGMRSLKTDAVFFIPQSNLLSTVGASLESMHNSHRNTRGRITRETGKNPYYTWQSMIIDLARTKVSHVGKTKSAWLKAFNFFADRAVGMIARNIPSWVTRHSSWGSQYGVHSMQINESSMTGLLQAGSNVPWVGQHREQREVDWATQLTLKDLTGGNALMRLNKIFKAKSAVHA